MNYVVWDIETDSAQLDWATMIEVGAILLDENFKEKDRFSARCRMPQDRVPSSRAFCIYKSNVDLIMGHLPIGVLEYYLNALNRTTKTHRKEIEHNKYT